MRSSREYERIVDYSLPAADAHPVVEARRLSIRWSAASRRRTPVRYHRTICCRWIMSTATRVFVVCGVPVRLADLSAGTAARLAWAREAGDTSSLARVLLDMADLDLRAGRLDDAAGHLRESLQLATRTGDATAGAKHAGAHAGGSPQQSYDPR
jgi:hypothetical protein